MSKPTQLRIYLILTLSYLLYTGVRASEKDTWLLEVTPVLIAVPVLIRTRRRFELSALVYFLLFLHGLVLAYGGQYTYAKTPLGFWLQETLGFSRNPYDRIGHLMQGFVPALLAREILIRARAVAPAWLFAVVTSMCLAFSAFYEFIEWWVALFVGGPTADAFLGIQGDVWDTQWDMFLAFSGAMLAQWTLGRAHDRSMARLEWAKS